MFYGDPSPHLQVGTVFYIDNKKHILLNSSGNFQAVRVDGINKFEIVTFKKMPKELVDQNLFSVSMTILHGD